jgi:hypothetical protein
MEIPENDIPEVSGLDLEERISRGNFGEKERKVFVNFVCRNPPTPCILKELVTEANLRTFEFILDALRVSNDMYFQGKSERREIDPEEAYNHLLGQGMVHPIKRSRVHKKVLDDIATCKEGLCVLKEVYLKESPQSDFLLEQLKCIGTFVNELSEGSGRKKDWEEGVKLWIDYYAERFHKVWDSKIRKGKEVHNGVLYKEVMSRH